MKNIDEYILKTKSAVQTIFNSYNSYLDLLYSPERPVFSYWGDPESEENKKKYQNWSVANQEKLNFRFKKDEEFVFELFARSTLAGTILQFAYHGIKIFSKNKIVPDKFSKVIQTNSAAVKFCIGRLINDVPLGLIIFAGRNQSMHFDDKNLKEPNKTIMNFLANWYDPRFDKWFIDSHLDLNNKDIIHFGNNILSLIEWNEYIQYEKDMIEIITTEENQ